MGRRVSAQSPTPEAVEKVTYGASDPTTTSGLYYLLSDASGSTVLIADAQGRPVARSRYDPLRPAQGKPFGSVAATQVWYSSTWSDPTTLPLTCTDRLYRGDPLERALNLYYTPDGRYYDPCLGKHLA